MSRFLHTMVTSATTTHPSNWILTGEPDQPVTTPWSEIHLMARTAAARLAGRGVTATSAVAVLAGRPIEVAPVAQGVWLAGGSVTMLHQPTARTDLARFADETLTVLKMIDASFVVLGSPFEPLAGLLAERGISYALVSDLVAPWDGPGAEPPAADADVAGEDTTALLQLTSGSTATPKAVRITHGNLIANLEAMVLGAALDSDSDVMVTWLPLFHDMGMVGFLTVPMTVGLRLVAVSPQDFLARPVLWMELISRYGGTVTAAPNFAYAVVAKVLRRASGLDLSSLRFALNGAEPIDADAVRSFLDAGEPHGLRRECMVCAYGMAEVTLAVSFAHRDRGIEIDEIDARALENDRLATPVEPGTSPERIRRFPLLGPPLRGIGVRVVDDEGATRGDREVGLLQLRGDSVTPGYLTVDGPLATVDADGWLDTGDEGYLVDGQIVVCGRRKDVIIMGGRNLYPTDIERAATSVEGVRAGNAVAVRSTVSGRRESFAVAVESHAASDAEAAEAIRKKVTAAIVDAIGARPSAVVVLPPSTLPKTPSGKLRRAAAIDLIERAATG